jgi:hypothetical protein
MFDSEYLGAWDLNGRDVVVIISHAKAGELTGTGGKKSKKPIVYFQGKKKGMALNKTNMRIVANLYGYDTSQWKGKPIALYPTRTSFGGVEMDCIRIRPTAPQPNGKRQQSAEDAPQMAVTEDGEVIEREPGDDSDQEEHADEQP